MSPPRECGQGGRCGLPSLPPRFSSEAVKKSRWDVSDQQKKEDILNELISSARQQSSASTPPTSTSSSNAEVGLLGGGGGLQRCSSGEQQPQHLTWVYIHTGEEH